MTAKITLYSQKELIEEMKLYAKSKNTSVSKIVNEFFKNLLKADKQTTKNSHITDSLVGILKDKDIDKDEYHKYLEEKYL